MKKIICAALPLLALVACVNVGGGSSSSVQPLSQFTANGLNSFLTTTISFTPTNNISNPNMSGANSCYTVTTSKTFIYYPTTSCYSIAVGGGGSPAATPLTNSLRSSFDNIMSASMDESGNGYFNISPQAGTGSPYILKCLNVINGGGGTCLSPESAVVPTGGVLGSKNSLANDVYGRLYMIGSCNVGLGIPAGQQCVMVSFDGAKTWQSITDTLASNPTYTSLRFSNLFMANQPGTPGSSTLYVVMSYNAQSLGTQTQMMQVNVPSTASVASYAQPTAWAGAPYANNVTKGNLIAVNPNTIIFYTPGSVGNYYNTPGYLTFYGHNPSGPYPAYLWQSESVNYNNLGASSVSGISFDNQNHIFITTNDGTSYYGSAPQ